MIKKNCYLETRHREPIAQALYVKILTWLRGFTDKVANFSGLDLTRHSQRRLEQKETQTKHRNTTKEHRSHVRILIYRTGFQRDNLIGHFRVPKTLMHFQNEAKCTTFLVEISLICVRMKNDFHIKGWALNLVLKQRPRGTRKWPLCHHSGIRFIRGGPILIVCARMFNCKILSTSACCFLINDSDRWLSRTHSAETLDLPPLPIVQFPLLSFPSDCVFLQEIWSWRG